MGEQFPPIGGGQAPMRVHALLEAAHTRVREAWGDAVQLELGGAQAIGG